MSTPIELDIRGTGLQGSPALTGHIRRRLGFALGRLSDRATQVKVCLSDLNGRRGGRAERACRISVQVPGAGSVMIRESGSDPYAVVDRAADRVKIAASRTIGKQRAHKRSR